MKNILYLIHVPWGWIKQRPHFIAENLSKYYKINVFYKKAYRSNNLVRNKISNDLDNIEIKGIFGLPFEKYNLIQKISSIIIRFQLKKIIDKFDLVWITHPDLFETIKNILPNDIRIIYDCMDDSLEFPYLKSNSALTEKILRNEEELIKKSDIVFASSDYLRCKLIDRYKITKNIYVINNAVSLDKIHSGYDLKIPFYIENKFKKTKIKLSYTGTISRWIDMDILLESLKRFKDITYMFFGPKEINLPKHNRLLYFGPIEHKYIFNIMKQSDALIIPFKLNELVLSVNPVKLYEYIFSGKPSIVIEYGETLKFKNYVYLYKNKDDYFNLIEKLVNNDLPPKRNLEESRNFALNNTWEKRIKGMVNIIEDIF